MRHFLLWAVSRPFLWAIVAVIAGPYFYWRGFSLLKRKRLISDTPRSTVRAAALGPVEVTGKAVGPYTLISPMSGTECLYYRMVIETNPTGDLRQRIQELCAPLFLDDGTGTLMIYPKGAELRLPPSLARLEHGKLGLPPSRHTAEKPEFIQEYCIQPGETIFVLGTVQESPWSKQENVVATNELSRIGPGFVSAAEADVLRREAFPCLDPSLPAVAESGFPHELDLHPPVILMQGHGPFVISSDSPQEVVAKLNCKSLLYIWGGPAALLWGLWQIVRTGFAGR